jgi:16S rRNA (guanine966-N2)-methyltransferase
MLRRKIYDYYQDLNGANFVDLCAGSGAMGIEAWSRGAGIVFLNEISRNVFTILEENRENLLIKNHHKKCGEINCHFSSAPIFLKKFKLIYEKMSKEIQAETIIFLDPPYTSLEVYFEIIQILLESPWYFGQLWIESDPKKGISQGKLAELGLKSLKVFEHGENFIFVTNFPQAI